jgi:hypothetical protein
MVRFGNVDFVLARALRQRSSGEEGSLLYAEEDDVDHICSYDSACQYSVNAGQCFKTQIPDVAPLVRRMRWAIPALHIQGHKEICMYLFGTAYMDGIGHFHGETAEHYWP